MGRYFGTDGFRGEANVGLTVEHAYKIGRFLGHYYGKESKVRVVLGKDTRRSSYMLEYGIVAGLTASGADAYLLHVTPTPSVAYVTRTEGFDCGIMISASHNPYYDNGIKILNRQGYKLEKEVEDLIENYIDRSVETIPLATGDAIGKTVDHSIGRHRYIGYLISLVTYSFQHKKVGIDCANGSSSTIAKGVFDALGAKTYVIHSEPNGFNINEECGSTHLKSLRKLVLEKELDVGFAYDGDADRCLAIDEKGNIIDGDHILYLCGIHLKEKEQLNNNTVVATVMSNLGLKKGLEREGIDLETTKVGDKYVFERMIESGYCLGGEQSGHIIFSKHATTGDGVLTSLQLMEIMLEKKQSLYELSKGLYLYPQLVHNVKVLDKDKAVNDAEILKLKDEIMRQLDNQGRILIRKSGTEPKIRIMVEAKEEKICRHFIDLVVEKLEENHHIAKS